MCTPTCVASFVSIILCCLVQETIRGSLKFSKVEVLGLTDLTVFIPTHPTEIVQFVDGNFTILLQIRDETS